MTKEQEIKNTDKKTEVKWFHKKWVRFVAAALAVVMILSAVGYAILRAQLASVYADISDSDETVKSISQKNIQDIRVEEEYEAWDRYTDILEDVDEKRYPEAIEKVQEALKIEENAVVRDGLEELLSELYYNEQRFEEAVETADRCIRNHKKPKDKMYYVRGMGYVQLGEYSLATEDLKKCIGSDEISQDNVNLQLAISTYSDKKYDEAITYSKGYLERENDDILTDDETEDPETRKQTVSNENLCRYIGAVSYMHTEEYENSVKLFDELIKDSEDSELYYYRGIDHMALEDYESAVTDFSKAKELGKTDTEVDYDLGICLVSSGRVDEGIKELQIVIEKNDRPELTTSSTNILTALAQEY